MGKPARVEEVVALRRARVVPRVSGGAWPQRLRRAQWRYVAATAPKGACVTPRERGGLEGALPPPNSTEGKAMAESARVELTVLGETLSIRTGASPDYLRSLGSFIEERAHALGAGTRSLTSALLLTALDIADELFRAREEQSRQAGDVDARLGALVTALERVCVPDADGSRPLTPAGRPGT